jgi:AraC family transcriptional regulator
MQHAQQQTTGSSISMRVPGFEVLGGVHAATSVLARHTHETPTICSVQYGRFTEYYPGKAFDCDARTLKITPAGEPHWNRFAAVDTFGLRIDVDRGTFGELPAIAGMLDERVFFEADAFALLTAQLVRELSRPDDLSPLAIEGLLLELLAQMARLKADRTPRVPRYVRAAHDLVAAQFRTRVTVEGIARTVGVPAPQLARAFRREYTCTIAQKIRQLRVEYAASALAATDAPLAEIALRAGFYDQSHFSNAFRRHFGVTPSTYRNRRSV